MLIKIFSLKGFFNFRSQLCENTIIGISVVVATLTLVHQSDIDKRHERNRMLALLTFISLRVGVITVGDEFGCLTIEFLVGTLDGYFDFFIVDMQPDM